MSKEEVAEQMQRINQLSEEEQRYLYGECDKWCLDTFIEGLQIVAIMEKDNHENGITHCYLRNLDNGLCYDVRGEYGSDEEIIAYTGVDYYSNNIEEYIFDNIENFKKFLKWIDFEIIRQYYLAG
ncbi:hypothetical protein FMM74_014070 [Lachnospiraceae bacterium MD308]|nr:hypothetical protein [Lachnospiraceae bacterium MD308]